MLKSPAHQWQWRHHNKGNSASLTMSNKCVHTHANEHIICLCLHTPSHMSYVRACKPACKPCKSLLWAIAQQISLLPHFPPLFCNIYAQNLGLIDCAKTTKRQQQLCWCYKNKLLVLVWTLFLGWIGFLSKTALSQPSQQGNTCLDKGVSTISRARLSNCVRHWMHQGGGGLALRKGTSHIGDFGLATNLSLFFSEMLLYFVLCLTKMIFFWQKMSI